MNNQHESELIKSKLIINNVLKAIYLVDGTKINIIWDKNNNPILNIEKTPKYTPEKGF